MAYFYEIAPTKIVRLGSDSFTYYSDVPLDIGSVVKIPVGKSIVIGVVIKTSKQPAYATKPVGEIIYTEPLPGPLLETLLWISSYYATPLALVLQTALPSGISKKRTAARKQSIKRPTRNRTHFLFNKDQIEALKSLETATPGTVLVHGITGSGKTALYIEYAKRIIASGRSVILIVPEIALTSQLVAEFSADFPELILTHSHQTEASRHRAWEKVLKSTEPNLIIGPRSALFMPVAKLGAIIIDEAHEPSLKQDKSPKYSSLRVASVLAKNHDGITVQGTATPLISEYYLAQSHHRPILSLPEKAMASAVAPTVTVVDMTKRASFTRHQFLSNILLQKIEASTVNHEQALIFHNRRGSASTTLCKQCGWSAICPNCFVPYTLHADKHKLLCHICGSTAPVPTSCPVCSSTDIVHKGIGTKLIESEIHKLFPNLSVARFDADSKSTETLANRYQELYDGDIDIIIGTQIVAKGLDLPKLRTVGIIQADAGLALPDYTSSERTFQLLAQVIGRVGRTSAESEVVVQTYKPSDSAVMHGIAQNYTEFYDEAIKLRKISNFPPFAYLLKLTCSYKTEATAIRNSKALHSQLRSKYHGLSILGPTPAFHERLRDSYRWQIVVKSKERAILLEIISQDLPKVGWQFDLDPYNLL
ncbi:MAG: primosomal protein N' [Candidatus Saccharimonas sp.]